MKNPLSWGCFALLACAAAFFITHTGASLPAMVASHFDAAGYPDTFVTRAKYTKSLLIWVILVPLALVALLSFVYTRGGDMKLPNRDYWLAPERIGQTRAMLVAHGIWFGSLLIGMGCFVHWLELVAHRQVPVRLPNAWVYAGLLVFFMLTICWVTALWYVFRRPRGA